MKSLQTIEEYDALPIIKQCNTISIEKYNIYHSVHKSPIYILENSI